MAMDHGRCSSSFIISILPSILVCIMGVWIFMQKRKQSRMRPPGPRALPFIGHLHLLGPLPHHSLYELSKVHGPLMSLRLGNVPIVVASSPAMARLILKEHDPTFADRLPTAAGNHLFGGTKGMVFSSAVGPHWRLLRRISATEIFSAKQLDRFRPFRVAEARWLMRSILAECDQTAGLCCLRPKLLQAMSNLTTRVMAGKSLEELAGGDAASILQLIVQVPKLLGTFNVGDYLPFLAWMDLQGCGRRSKKVANCLREAFERIIQARRLQNGGAGAANKDAQYFLDALLDNAASSSTPISIIGNFLEFFVGGTDTTALTMEWTLAELLRNPDKMHLAHLEIEQVVGRGRLVEEADIAHLPYLVACVKEAMRLHPVVPLLMPHGTSQACQIMGFQMPAKTQAYVNVWAIGRDSQIWDNPLEFLPERFLTSEPIDVQGQDFELLPFGSGRRICPGLRLAVPTMNLILACLLQGFEWTLSPSQQLDMTEHSGAITSMKTPLVAFSKPRLPKYLY